MHQKVDVLSFLIYMSIKGSFEKMKLKKFDHSCVFSYCRFLFPPRKKESL